MKHGECIDFKRENSMDKRAKRKHLKELKRKKVQRNIRIYGKQIPKKPKLLSLEELAKEVGIWERF